MPRSRSAWRHPVPETRSSSIPSAVGPSIGKTGSFPLARVGEAHRAATPQAPLIEGKVPSWLCLDCRRAGWHPGARGSRRRLRPCVRGQARKGPLGPDQCRRELRRTTKTNLRHDALDPYAVSAEPRGPHQDKGVSVRREPPETPLKILLGAHGDSRNCSSNQLAYQVSDTERSSAEHG